MPIPSLYASFVLLKANHDIHNSLIQPYLTYSILNWDRGSNTTMQPLINLQNKVIKLIRPTKQTSLEESFQYLSILCLPKFHTLSVGECMNSYYNKLLPYHFDNCFIPISSIHSYPTRLSTSNNIFLPGVNSSSVKCSLTFVGPKVWSSLPDCIKPSNTFTFKWKP